MAPNEPRFLVTRAHLLHLLLQLDEARDALDRAEPLLPATGPLRREAAALRARVDAIVARWKREGKSRGPWRLE